MRVIAAGKLRLHAIALGCQMSSADAEEMSEALAGRFRNSPELENADAVILSTCTVRDHAEHKALSMIGRLSLWKEAVPGRVLIVAGCAAERLKDTLQKRFPAIDLVVGAKSIGEFPKIVEEVLGGRFDALAESREAFETNSTPSSPHYESFVTIMRGCNYSCSYCIVPAVRGREIYRPVEDILDEVRRKTERGAREIMLLGQTVNSYQGTYQGQDVNFGALLRLVDKVDGVPKVRFMSPHPYFVDQDMVAAISECRSVDKVLHLPAQSGSDRILKLMRRNYTRAQFLEKARWLHEAVRGISLSTDIIVGFPTETDEEFVESLTLLRQMRASSAYTFKYSPRASTLSASWPDDVPGPVKEDRLRRINELIDSMKEAPAI